MSPSGAKSRGVRFRYVQSGDIAHIAANLRDADRREIAASRGPEVQPADAIANTVLRSSHVWIAVAGDGEPIAIFGVAPISMIDGIGSPWMLSTERVYEHPRALVTEARRYLSAMRETYPTLYNFVDARNDKSIRWLKRLGFALQPAAPYGPAGVPFHRFEMGRAG